MKLWCFFVTNFWYFVALRYMLNSCRILMILNLWYCIFQMCCFITELWVALYAWPLRLPPFCSVGACRVIAMQYWPCGSREFFSGTFFSSCFSSRCLHPGIEFPVVYDQYVVTVFLQCFCWAHHSCNSLSSQMEMSLLWKWTFSKRISWFFPTPIAVP